MSAGESSPDLLRVGRELRAPRAAGIAGLAFAVLFVLALYLLHDHPGAGAEADEIAEWYGDGGRQNLALVGVYVAPFSGIAFLWFIAVIRNRIGDREDRFFGTVFIGSGLLFIAMLFCSAAAAGSLAALNGFADAPVPNPDAVFVIRALSYALLYIYAVKAAAVFVAVTSTIALRTGALPRWLGIGGYGIAVVLLLSATYSKWIVMLFPLWVVVVSIRILLSDLPSDHSRAAATS